MKVCTFSERRLRITTCAPSPRHAREIPAPIPAPPPVTTISLSFRPRSIVDLRALFEPCHHQHARLRHLFNRAAYALAAQPRILHAAVWHRIEPPARRIANNQRSHFELTKRRQNAPRIARQQTRLQSILRVIRRRQCLFKILVRLNQHNRPEDFFIAHLHARLRRRQNRRRHQRSLALASHHQLRARAHAFFHPRLHSLRVAQSYQRTQLRRLIFRAAGHHLFRVLNHLPHKGLKYSPLREHSLHADARLSRIPKRCLRSSLRRVVQLRPVAVHNQSRIAAQFQQHSLASRVRFQLPTHLRRSRKAHQLDAVFLLRQPRRVYIRQCQHSERFLRPSGFQNHLTKCQRRKWRLWSRLHNYWTSRRQRRCHLVRHQVQRKVERRNCEHRANRKPLHQSPAVLIPF